MSIDKYIEDVRKQTKAAKDAEIKAKTEVADANKQLVTDSYNTQIAGTKEEYDTLFQKNEIQKVLNERYLERKAAEMGLTDSGMNRTQMTANQLSYASQDAEYSRQRQKAVDTLSAAMKAKLTEIDTGLKTDVANINSTYEKNAVTQGTENYNTAIEQQNAAIEAQQTALTDNFNDLYTRIYKERQDFATKDELGNLTYNNNPVHASMIYEYQKQSGLDTNSTQMKMLLNAAGISAEDYEKERQVLDMTSLNGEQLNEYIASGGQIKPTTASKALVDSIYRNLTSKFINTANSYKTTTGGIGKVAAGTLGIANATAYVVGKKYLENKDDIKMISDRLNNSGLSDAEKLMVMIELDVLDKIAELEEDK